jgi:uncharacterized protein (DUF2147 family)
MLKRLSLLFMLAFCATSIAEEIEGYWKHLSRDGEPECLISVYEYQDKYYGRIIGTYDADGKMNDNLYEPKDRADNVPGSPYYCGMDLLWNLQDRGERYKGKIIDPRNGKVYNAEVWVKNGNLIVRGELLFFGRNETWYPAEQSDFPADFKKPDTTTFIPVIPTRD